MKFLTFGKFTQQNKKFFPNLNEWWETGKQFIKNVLKDLSIEVNKSIKKKSKNIKNKLTTLLSLPLNLHKAAKIASLKEKLEKLYEINYEGSRIQAKTKKTRTRPQINFSLKKKKKQGKKYLV